MSRWSSGWSRAVTNNAVPRSFLHLEVVSTLLQRLNLLALRLRQHNRRAGVAYVYLKANAAQLAPLKTEGRLCVVAVHIGSHLLPRPAAGWNLLPALPGQD